MGMGQAAALYGGSLDQDLPPQAQELPSPAPWVGTSLPHTALLSKNNQALLWFQKATCSSWSFTCTGSTSCRLGQAASLCPSSGHRAGAAPFPLATLSLGRRGLIGGMLPFPLKKGVCLFPCRLPVPLNIHRSLVYTALESSRAWVG